MTSSPGDQKNMEEGPPNYNDSHSEHSSQFTQRKRKGRHGTTLKELTKSRANDQRLPIAFDKQWRPIGPNKSKFVSFVALQARSKPGLTIKEWYEVPESVKDQIWNTIVLTYDVPPSHALKDKLLSYCTERWTAFKTSLTKRFVYIEVAEGETPPNPCEEYPWLDEDTWREFYRMRTTPEALVKREKAKASARANDCPHILSRGGYELLEQQMMKEKQKRREEEAQSDPSTVVSPPSPISREEKWRAARRKKTGTYTSEKARVVAEKIDQLQLERGQGSFIPEGRNDILIAATGKAEHGGRVRGVGRGIGVRDFFGTPTHRASSGMLTKEEVELILENERRQAAAQMQQILENERKQAAAQMAAQMAQMKEEMMTILSSREDTTHQPTHSPAVQSTKGSCVLEDVGVQQNSEPCELYIEDPYKRLVALGIIHNLGPTVHHQQMKDDEVRVVVREVKISDAPVPYPTDEVKLVGEALQTFIRWPMRLIRVVPVEQTVAPTEVVPQLQPQSQTQSQVNPLQRLCLLAFAGSFTSQVLIMDPSVLGLRDVFVHLEQEDIVRILMKDQITIPHVQLWMMYLHRLCIVSGNADKFGFLCPIHIQPKANTPAIRANYLRQRLCEDGKECYLAPYVYDTHWQLVLVCPDVNVAVLLCSLHYKPGKDLKKMMQQAMQTYQLVVGRKHAHELKEIIWVQPKCRRQTGTNACGYYVMRHMLNIILLGSTDFTEEMFDITDAFPEEDIDDVRTRWATYFFELTDL